jgi:NAD(P)-dependent dehydrogenase (short-subunit alcohol dehydrogenase family)
MLQDRIAIITGGTGALGAAVTRHFLAVGASCAVPFRKDAERDALVRAVGADAARLFCHRADLLRDEEREAFLAAALGRFGGVDLLLNLAGGFAGGTPVAETDPATLDRMLDLNLRTVFLMSRAVIPHLKTRGGGRILSVAARAALHGVANLAAYSAAKAAVVSLTQAMAAELLDDDIQVNCILPSTIDTPANRRAMPAADPSRWVAPEQIAAVLAFFASDDARIPVYGRA